MNKTNGKLAKRLLKEGLFMEWIGMKFKRNSEYFEIFDEKLQQLVTAGIIDHLISFRKEMLNLKRYAHLYRDEPQVLTMKNLEAGFVIWLISVSIAVCVFICEWISRLHDMLVLEFILVAYQKQAQTSLEIEFPFTQTHGPSTSCNETDMTKVKTKSSTVVAKPEIIQVQPITNLKNSLSNAQNELNEEI
jgi:hypothetical protein